MEVGRALGLQWDLVGRSVQSVMLHAMRLRLALVGLTAQVDLTAPVVLTAQVDLTAPVVLTALGPMGARRRDLVWLTRHIMQSHAQ